MSPGGRGGPPGRARSHVPELPALLVFVEGTKTEVDYINNWYRRYRFRVLIEIDPFHGGPLQLVEHAVEAKKREARESKRFGKVHDQYWCVFDRDIHPRFEDALDLARSNSISLAISNPCIELWFILHFQDQSRHLERDEAQSSSRQILRCGKNLTSEALDAFELRYPDARDRAQGLARWHEEGGNPPLSNPSSSVWELIQAISGE